MLIREEAAFSRFAIAFITQPKYSCIKSLTRNRSNRYYVY